MSAAALPLFCLLGIGVAYFAIAQQEGGRTESDLWLCPALAIGLFAGALYWLWLRWVASWLPSGMSGVSGWRWVAALSLWTAALTARMTWAFTAWRVAKVFPHWAAYRLPHRIAVLVLVAFPVAGSVALARGRLWREGAIVDPGVE